MATTFNLDDLELAVRFTGHPFGSTVDEGDIDAALRRLGFDAGSTVNDSDVRRLIREYVKALPNIGDGAENVAENIISGERTLRQAAEKFGAIAPDRGLTDDDPSTLPGVLTGGETIRVGADRFYQIYEFPPGSGNFVAYQYNSREQVEAALGQGFEFTARSESWFNQNVLAEAQAEQVVGLAGNWQGLTSEIMRDAAVAAGINDPSLIGQIAANPEMQQIMAQAVVGDWTPEQILAAQRQTDFWQNTLYPGINAFYGRTTNPEKAWLDYVGNVSPALTALGYKKDAAGTYNDQIQQMLNSGIDAQTFLENAPIFAQAVQNQDFFNVLRARAKRELDKDITFGDWFGLLKGEAAPDIQRVAEGAIVAYQAQQADVGLGESMLQRLIAESDLSQAEATNVFSQVNQAVLALGESGLKRGGLSRDDVISAMANISPASGLNAEEVKLRVAKIARENDLFDEEKLSFYVGFTPAGTPTRPGLAPLAPEAG